MPEPDNVTWEDSREATTLIAQQAALLKLLPLDSLIEMCARADNVGAIFDPTGFMKHGRGIQAAHKIFLVTKWWIDEVQKAIEEAARA